MTDTFYKGFGSQIVIEPDVNSHDGDKSSEINAVSRWRNLRLKLKYFTMQSHPGDAEGRVNTSKNNQGESVDIVNGERILVIETKSCDSFHSCSSSISNKDLSKLSRENARKNRHQFSINKSSEEEFHNQITMINAIFLNKIPFKDKQCETKDEHLLNETNDSELETPGENCSFKGDVPKFSSDRISVNCDSTLTHNHQPENKMYQYAQDKKETQHPNVISPEPPLENLSATNTTFKPFKMNRKLIHGTKRPLMSKIVGRRGHHPMLYKLHPSSRIGIKNAKEVDKVTLSPENESGFNKALLLEVKQGISEGYDVLFYEPIQQTSLFPTISKTVDNPLSGLSENFLNDKDVKSDNQSREISNTSSVDNFEESLLKLYDKLQFSESNSSLLDDTEIFDESDVKNLSKNVDNSTDFNKKSNLKLSRGGDLLPGKQSEQVNSTVLPETLPNLAESFETLFENEDCLMQKTDTYINRVPVSESTTEDKIVTGIEVSNENKIKNKNEEKTKVNTVSYKATSKTITSSVAGNKWAKRRRSSSRKSSLAVIEEIPEPVQEVNTSDILDNDYCLIDTQGRSIHLFDRRGFPLTDGCGRPLRSAGGELLLKCDDNGIPVVDEETSIYDMFGKQPHEEGFQPWMCPQNTGANRLTLGDGRPLVVFDVEGKPLTSISGTMLVDSSGRTLLKLRNCFPHPT